VLSFAVVVSCCDETVINSVRLFLFSFYFSFDRVQGLSSILWALGPHKTKSPLYTVIEFP
jgi:hypothetical protein